MGRLSLVALLACPAMAAPRIPEGWVDDGGRDGLSESFELPAALGQELARAAIGARVGIDDFPVAPGSRERVELVRVELRAPGARILEVDPAGTRLLPGSDGRIRLLGATLDGRTSVGLSVDPRGTSLRGSTGGPRGSFEILEPAGGEPLHRIAPLRDVHDGNPLSMACGSDLLPPLADLERLARPSGSEGVSAASRQAVVAVDTDNELNFLKWANNTTAASTWIADLYLAMNVMYERDLDLTLLQGDTFLRLDPDPVPTYDNDPWNQTGTTASSAHLNEFGTYWSANMGSVPRVMAMLLSGKSASNFSSSGIAWIDGICENQSAGGAYSVTMVFKANIPVTNDVRVVGHELGHNFGSPHTHCYSPPVDQCYAGEGGCYSGPESCPGGPGTIMSYCHVSSAGCGSNLIQFHPTCITLLQTFITNHTSPGCIESGGCAPITANIVQASPNPACTNQTISFAGTGTGQGTLSYAWDWEDDGTYDATGASATHAYATAGTRTVRFRVTDSCAPPRTRTDTEVVQVASPVTVPTGLSATGGCGGVSLSWNAVAGATSYDVLRSGTSCASVAVIATGITGTSHVDTTGIPGTSYFYAVRAVGTCGTSAPSSCAQAASAACPALDYEPGTFAFAQQSGDADTASMSPGERWSLTFRMRNVGTAAAASDARLTVTATNGVGASAFCNNPVTVGALAVGALSGPLTSDFAVPQSWTGTCPSDVPFGFIGKLHAGPSPAGTDEPPGTGDVVPVKKQMGVPGSTVTNTYPGAGGAIPDNNLGSPFTASVTTTDPVPVTTATVFVTITHERPIDINSDGFARLRTPNGTLVALTPISSGVERSVVFTATYNAAGNGPGLYRLEVGDGKAGKLGTVDAWRIVLSTTFPPSCAPWPGGPAGCGGVPEVSDDAAHFLKVVRGATTGQVTLSVEDVGANAYNVYASATPSATSGAPFAVNGPGFKSCAVATTSGAPGMRQITNFSAPGSILYFLVSADDGPTTEGSLGKSSAGAERHATSYCNR